MWSLIAKDHAISGENAEPHLLETKGEKLSSASCTSSLELTEDGRLPQKILSGYTHGPKKFKPSATKAETTQPKGAESMF